MKYVRYIGGYEEYEDIELHIGEVYEVIERAIVYSTKSIISSVLINNNKGENKRYIIKDPMNNFLFEDVSIEYIRNETITEILE